MTTLTRTKTLNRQLLILSAGLLLQAHSVFAGDSVGDAQAQARAFLDPAVVHHATTVGTLATTGPTIAPRRAPARRSSHVRFWIGRPQVTQRSPQAFVPRQGRAPRRALPRIGATIAIRRKPRVE